MSRLSYNSNPAASNQGYGSPTYGATVYTPPADSEQSGALTAATAAMTPSNKVRIRRRDLMNFTSQIAIMVRSGVDVTSALASICRQCRRPALKQVLTTIHHNVLSGSSLSKSLQEFRQAFGPTYVATVAAGEAAGQLPEVFGQLASMLRGEIRLRSTLRSMIIYPIVLAVVSLAVVLTLVVFVLPQFAEIFSQFNTSLPELTSALLLLGDSLQSYWWFWLPVLAMLVGLIIAYRKTDAGRIYWDRALLTGPIIRRVTQPLAIGRACRLLGLMIGSGMPVLESLKLVRDSMNNALYVQLLNNLEIEVLNGRPIGPSLSDAEFIPPEAAEMLTTAEQTGSIGETATLLGEYFEEEGELRMREVITMLEPAITVGMGAVVTLVVLAVLLPMLEISTFAQ